MAQETVFDTHAHFLGDDVEHHRSGPRLPASSVLWLWVAMI